MGADDPTADVQAALDVLTCFDDAFRAALRCAYTDNYDVDTMLTIWGAIEECQEFVARRLGFPPSDTVFGVFVDGPKDVA
jgi:hypothetical protein